MVEFGNLSLSLSHTISLWALRVSLPSHNSQAILPSLSLSATSGLFLSTHIFLFNLSNSLFLLNLNPQRPWVFLVGFIWFFCGFVWVQFDYLWVLFDLFVHFVSWCFQWFVLGLSLFSISILICGFVMQIMCLMKCFYELSMSCEVINKGIYIVLVNLASNKPSWQTEFGLVNAQRHDQATEI